MSTMLAVASPALARPRLANYLLDLDREPPPLTWAVPTFAAHGALTLLVAQPSVGKTWLAMQLARGVAHGETVAGFACAHGRSIYIDGENPGELHRRVRAADMEPSDRFVCVDGVRAGLRLERPTDRADLRALVENVGATFVVLDSLRALTRETREDASDDMGPLIRELGNLAHETGAAIVLVHHASVKSGSATSRGSSAIIDQVDVAFSLSRKGGDADLRTLAVLDRKYRIGPIPPPRHLRFVDDPPGFAEVRQLSNREALAERIAELEGQWKLAELAVALRLDPQADADRKQLQRALDLLTNAGSWTKVRHGVYAPC